MGLDVRGSEQKRTEKKRKPHPQRTPRRRKRVIHRLRRLHRDDELGARIGTDLKRQTRGERAVCRIGYPGARKSDRGVSDRWEWWGQAGGGGAAGFMGECACNGCSYMVKLLGY